MDYSIMKNIDDIFLKSASCVKNIEFLTDSIKKISNKRILFLNKIVNREETIIKFNKLIKNMDIAISLEAGVYEFTLVYGLTKNLMGNLLSAIYHDKVYDLLSNLDENSPLKNNFLKKKLLNNELNPQHVAFLPPQEIHPEQWKDLKRKVQLKEDKKKNMATTDLYQCVKCKERKCQVMQIQTRGADESMTLFISCLNCYHVMKK